MLSDLTELGVQILERDLLLFGNRKEVLQRLFCDTELFGNGAMFLGVNTLNIVEGDGAFVGLDDGGTSGRPNGIDVASSPLNTLGVGSRHGDETHCQYEAHDAYHVSPSVRLHGLRSPWLISIVPLPVWMTAGPLELSIRLTSRPAVGSGFC